MNATGDPMTLFVPPRSRTKSKSCAFPYRSVHLTFFPSLASRGPFLSKYSPCSLANFRSAGSTATSRTFPMICPNVCASDSAKISLQSIRVPLSAGLGAFDSSTLCFDPGAYRSESAQTLLQLPTWQSTFRWDNKRRRGRNHL